MPRTNQPPKYRRQKSRNLAVVRINGHDHYLGTYGSPESYAQYAQLIATWQPNRGPDREPTLAMPSVEIAANRDRATPHVGTNAAESISTYELALRYLEHADVYYRKHGEPTGEIDNIKLALKPLLKHYGSTAASAFQPPDLVAIRKLMIDDNLSRGVINGRVSRIKRAFAWATTEGLVPSTVFYGLQAIKPLKAWRSEARETEPIRPVDLQVVCKASVHMNTIIRAMVNVQLLTGMRPQGVRLMRSGDIDMSRDVWVYRPNWFKTEHLDHVLRIAIGPRAQGVLKPFLKPDRPDELVFRPSDAAEQVRKEKRAQRRTPLTPSQRARQKKARPQRQPREMYTKQSYRRAVVRACDKAGVERWHPHRLRHTSATEIRRKYGLETASIILGHQHGVTTEIYAEADFEKAIDAMREFG